jgi:hypothetical protein
VSIQIDGETYNGTYTVDGPMVALETLTLGVKRAQLGDSAPEVLARLLLAELVYEADSRVGR